VRVIPSKLSSGSVLALLAALVFLAQSGETAAQSQSRSFQMALYVDFSDPGITKTDTDIAMFGEGQPQPPGRSIMKYKSWPEAAPLASTLAQAHYDWTRIIAAVVDEPYTYLFDNDEDFHNPCGTSRLSKFTQTTQLLNAGAAALKSVAPWARFWVIFTPAEVAWMQADQCPETRFNQSYIDVISFDQYYDFFDPSVKPAYVWLADHPATPQQQVALLPGTFYRPGKDDPARQAAILQGYFDYAESENQSCNLPLGPRGVTGTYDGCRVWMVLGWSADNLGTTYVGEQDPQLATTVGAVWRSEVATPVRRGLSYELTRAQIVASLIQNWLTD
jgi:hypothetical protein